MKKVCFGGLELAHTKVLPQIVVVQKNGEKTLTIFEIVLMISGIPKIQEVRFWNRTDDLGHPENPKTQIDSNFEN